MKLHLMSNYRNAFGALTTDTTFCGRDRYALHPTTLAALVGCPEPTPDNYCKTCLRAARADCGATGSRLYAAR